MMGPVVWVLLAVIIASFTMMITKERGEEYFGDIIFSVVGAMIGGTIGQWIGWQKMLGANLHSIIISVIGAIVALIIYHALVIGRVRGRHGPVR